MQESNKALNDLFVFVHIPKTGGSYFSNCVESSIPSHLYTTKNTIDIPLQRIDTVTEEQKKRIRLIDGHHCYKGIHEPFRVDAKYITFIRNPLSRLFSMYNFKRMLHHRFHPIKNRLDQADQNRIDRFTKIIGNNELITFQNWLDEFFFNPNSLRATMTQDLQFLGYLGKELSESAIRRDLSYFYYVGTMERSEQDILYLFHELQVSRLHESKNESVRYLSPDSIAPNLLAKIKEKLSIDELLYSLAKERMEQFRKTAPNYSLIVHRMEEKKRARISFYRMKRVGIERTKKILGKKIVFVKRVLDFLQQRKKVSK